MSNWYESHGRPSERRHSLQIEINRKLYMDEVTLEKIDGFVALQANLKRLVELAGAFVLRAAPMRPGAAVPKWPKSLILRHVAAQRVDPTRGRRVKLAGLHAGYARRV